jgi:hypothetical protein
VVVTLGEEALVESGLNAWELDVEIGRQDDLLQYMDNRFSVVVEPTKESA